MNLLIVDDNSKFRSLLKDTLTNNLPGVENIYECEDGLDAVKKFSELNPDYTLMDIKMNKMDGLTASKHILEKYPNAKILIVTSFFDKEYKEYSKSIGIKAVIEKDNLMEILNYVV